MNKYERNKKGASVEILGSVAGAIASMQERR